MEKVNACIHDWDALLELDPVNNSLKVVSPWSCRKCGLIVRDGVPAGVAYMPVPRCDQCKHWIRRGIRNYCNNRTLRLKASLLFVPPIETEPDFGCVQWEAK
jgi:hypothetical protein